MDGQLLTPFWREHTAQNSFHCHRMTAYATLGKKVAVTSPVPLMIFDGMSFVVTVEDHPELTKYNPVRLFGVSPGFLDFADHR